MAYPISQEVLSLFTNQLRQVVEIKVEGLTETMTLTEKDVSSGGLTIDRYCVSGSRIEIGSAVAAELSLTLDNKDGRFDNTVFEGAELFVRIGIKKWDARNWEKATVHYIPMGYFTVDTPPRKLSSISLSALDRMVLFDKECKSSDIKFPMSINELLVRICTICGVTLATDSTTLTNSDYKINKFPEGDGLTYRQILMWIAEITGTCAYIDWNGQLRLEWYGEESSAELSPDMRYSSDINDKTITITGVRIVGNDETVYLQGTDEYAFNIESNGLLQSNISDVVTALYDKLDGFSYTPYSCVAKPLVHLYPLDRVDFVDKQGNKISSIVTNATFTMNANLSLAGQGETETSASYARANPITKQEATIINAVKKEMQSEITTRQQSIIEFNKSIINSMGLYFSEETLADGSTVYYYHDQPKKEDSSIIYTFRAGGFAWSTKWDGENTVWNYGITRDGNAVLNILSTFQINSEHIQAGSITSEHIRAGSIGAESLSVDVVSQDELNTLEQNLTAADGVLSSDIKQLQEDTSGLQTSFEQTSVAIEMTASKTFGATIHGEGHPDFYESSTIPLTKSSLYYDTSAEQYYYYNALNEAWEECDGEETIQSSFTQTADGFELSGLVKIDGSLIIDGTISASAIDTENLSCTRLYAKDYPDDYSFRLKGNYGDFGIYNASADDNVGAEDSNCMWGVYNDLAVIKHYIYGTNWLNAVSDSDGLVIKPKGIWDFGDLGDGGEIRNLKVTAVFGV